MEIKGKQKVEREVAVDIVCNKCGESCKDYIDAAHQHHNFNYASISPSFGYGSFLDGDDFEVHLCDYCYDEFEKTFKIKPEKKKDYWGGLL